MLLQDPFASLLEDDLLSSSSNILRPDLLGICFPPNGCLSAALLFKGFSDVELSSVFSSVVSVDTATLIPFFTGTPPSTVISSDLWIASLPDLHPSVLPLRDVVADSELTSGCKNEFWTREE
ncbi:hypothetical protein LINGRAHAP2_LOCUS31771 [Linum grandiflorum]